MEGNGKKIKRGRPPLRGRAATTKFSLSMTEEMRARVGEAARALSEERGAEVNASEFVREAVEEKLKRMGE